MNIDAIRNQLEKCNQQQVLKFYDELDKNEKNALIEQINSIDDIFWNLSLLNQKSTQPRGKIEPIKTASINDIAENSEEYMNIGIDLNMEKLPQFFLPEDKAHVSVSTNRKECSTSA